MQQRKNFYLGGKLLEEENCFSLLELIRVNKSMRTRWESHVVWMGHQKYTEHFDWNVWGSNILLSWKNYAWAEI